MQKMNQSSKMLQYFSLLFLWIVILLVNSCGKTTKYANDQTYDKHVDTATLIVKITNMANQPVDVSIQPTTLLLFDSKNLYFTQRLSKQGITTKDTSITINGIPMGHYTALLIVDAPGIINLNYLAIGKQSYQNVLDTLQYLLTDTYVASTQGIIVNNKVNTGSVNFEPLVSLISQVSFDLSGLMNTPIWQNPKLEDYGLYFLVFQNNMLVMSRPVKSDDIKEAIYQTPIAKGANYNFIFTDLVNESTSPANKDSMINGKTTPQIVQQKLETHIDNIRMGTVGIGSLLNLVKTEQEFRVTNGIKSVPVVLNGNTTPQWNTSTNDWSLLIFDQTGFLKRIINPSAPITTNPSPKDALVINVFNASPYTLLAIGNAPNAVGKYQAQNITNPITAEYIGSNLQSIQDYIYSWVAMGSGTIANMLVGGVFKIIPEVRLNFNKMTAMTIAEVRKQTGNYFADNPRRVTGIITSIGKNISGKVENSIPNLVILQDGQNAAIPIKFDTFPSNLNIGDQITIALQNGLMTNSNVNANNILVLENVTYTEIGRTIGVGVPTAKILTLADAIDPNIYKQYESMLVTIKDLEFKWFTGLDYGRFSADSTILRDNTVDATTLPSSRKIIRMLTSKNATVKFSGTPVPKGKVNSITGFLTKTPSGNKNIAITPRIQSDIAFTNNLADRVDDGKVAYWSGDLNANSGVSREGATITANSKLGSGNLTSNPIKMWFDWGGGNSGKGIIFTINTSNLVKGEDVKISLMNGFRYGGYGDAFGAYYTALSFEIQYSIDGGTTWGVAKDDNGNVRQLIMNVGFGATNTNFSLPLTYIKGIGGYTDVKIAIVNLSGLTSYKWGRDRELEFYNINIDQFTE